MVWTRSPVYFYQRNDIYYFSRAVPKDLQARFNKRRVEVSLKTKSADKARSLSMTLSDRLERYWDSLRLEQIHSRELGLSLINADLRPDPGEQTLLKADEIAKTYLHFYCQDRSTWSWEIELRPWVEKFSVGGFSGDNWI